ncbi:MAG: type II toxin-antitoxin system VapC family toxin [Deltaproteobacteria bacterium]|nr:type II toxin-antitoxin system VapC family toxin [Deltaproteobacteria bacterium]
MIVLDTHALVWWLADPRRLGRAARSEIGRADTIGVPTIVFWEVAMLVRRRRLAVGDVDLWTRRVLELPRVAQLPLDAATAILAERLDMHPDPADRFIVATSLAQRAALVTKDERIRGLHLVPTIW